MYFPEEIKTHIIMRMTSLWFKLVLRYATIWGKQKDKIQFIEPQLRHPLFEKQIKNPNKIQKL